MVVNIFVSKVKVLKPASNINVGIIFKTLLQVLNPIHSGNVFFSSPQKIYIIFAKAKLKGISQIGSAL